MHPYSVAKMITSLAYLHGRAVDLNMLAGGFRNDLVGLGDDVEHDLRYERTVEYTKIVSALLGGETVTLQGRWHNVQRLELNSGAAARACAGPPDLRLLAGWLCSCVCDRSGRRAVSKAG